MPVTRDEVVWAYRMFLGRDPESEEAILHHTKHRDRLTLRNLFTGSPEFQAFTRQSGIELASPSSLPLDIPKIQIDSEADEEQLRACISKIKAAWTHLGNTRPHYSVLTDDQFLPENLESSIEAFWQSGESEAAAVERVLNRYELGPLEDKICVEYGCGVGRVTTALARRFAFVHGYDISPGHLAYAWERADETGVGNVAFHLCSEAFSGDLENCDFFYSTIVFQHNPPPVIRELIRYALRALNSGGIAIFQVPTYRLGYHFDTAKWLEEDHDLDMQMHCLPQRAIFEIILEEGCALLEIREDNLTGAREIFISNTFIVGRPEAEKANGNSGQGLEIQGNALCSGPSSTRFHAGAEISSGARCKSCLRPKSI